MAEAITKGARGECPLGDSLRSVCPWFALCGLLLLRRATRTLLLPLVVLYVALYLGENTVNRYALWYVTPSICSTLSELLRAMALRTAKSPAPSCAWAPKRNSSRLGPLDDATRPLRQLCVCPALSVVKTCFGPSWPLDW